MKILLFGKDGQLGWELQRSLAVLGEVVPLGRQEADFARPPTLAQIVRRVSPDVIVNAAAYTAVDRAESEAALAQVVNADAVEVLAREAARSSSWLVHYGTDYVFDGTGDAPRDEASPPAPLSVYGRTKLAGEEAIRVSGCRHLILRTGWVYAARGGNFARTMLRLAGERERLTVVDDQVGAPTGADLLADVTAHALRSALHQPSLSGTYHAVAAGETSWHGYASFVVAWALRHGLPLKVQELVPVPTTAYPAPARRPLNSRLDTRKLRTSFGLALPAWELGVERMLTEAFL